MAARGNAGLLVTRDAGGEELLAAAAPARRGARGEARACCARLGAEVARLHEAGFVARRPRADRTCACAATALRLPRQRPHAPEPPPRRARRRAGTSCSSAASSCRGSPRRIARACSPRTRRARGLGRARRRRLARWLVAAHRRAALRDRPHPARRRRRARASGSSCGAAGRSIRRRRAGGARVKRALVTLSHPDHAGMLRALEILVEAAPRHGWEMRIVLAAPDPARRGGRAAARRSSRYLPGLRGWRRLASRLRAAGDHRPPGAHGARRRRALRVHAVDLPALPATPGASRGVPPVDARVLELRRAAGRIGSTSSRRARHVIAPSADSLALAERAIGGFAPGTRTHVAYNGMDVGVARGAGGGAGAAPASSRTARPRIGMVGNLDARKEPGAAGRGGGGDPRRRAGRRGAAGRRVPRSGLRGERRARASRRSASTAPCA